MSNKKFNIYEYLENRPLSWSAYDCFAGKEWGSPEKWYSRYVLGIKEPPSREMIFGSKIDKAIQNDPDFMPSLERFPFMQHKMDPVYKKIHMIGFADHWDPFTLRLADDKTGKTPWTAKRAATTGQLTMYAMMIYLMEGIKPEEIEFSIRWLPTTQHADLSIGFVEGTEIQIFKTKRTMVDILKMMAEIENTVKLMQEFARNHV